MSLPLWLQLLSVKCSVLQSWMKKSMPIQSVQAPSQGWKPETFFENLYSSKNTKNCAKDNKHWESIFNVHVLFGFLKLFQNGYNDCSNCTTRWKKLIVPNLSSQTDYMFVRESCSLRLFPHCMIGPLAKLQYRQSILPIALARERER